MRSKSSEEQFENDEEFQRQYETFKWQGSQMVELQRHDTYNALHSRRYSPAPYAGYHYADSYTNSPFYERENIPQTAPNSASFHSEKPAAFRVRASDRLQKRLNKLLRSAKSYRTKAAGAVQTRSPLDGRSYSRHVLIEGVKSSSRSKSKKRTTMRSSQSTSRFDPSPMQSNYIRVGDHPGSSSSLMFLSNTTPQYFESVRNPKSRSPDFARYQHGQHYVFQQGNERQTLSPSQTPKPRTNVPAPHSDVFQTLHTGEDKCLLNDTFDRPEGQNSHSSSIRCFSEDAEFIDFLKNIVLFCSGEDQTGLTHDQNSNLLGNLNYLKNCFENYKKAKTSSERPSPISRDVLESERIELPRQPSWRTQQRIKQEEEKAALEAKNSASINHSFDQYQNKEQQPLRGENEMNYPKRYPEKRISRLNSDPQLQVHSQQTPPAQQSPQYYSPMLPTQRNLSQQDAHGHHLVPQTIHQPVFYASPPGITISPALTSRVAFPQTTPVYIQTAPVEAPSPIYHQQPHQNVAAIYPPHSFITPEAGQIRSNVMPESFAQNVRYEQSSILDSGGVSFVAEPERRMKDMQNLRYIDSVYDVIVNQNKPYYDRGLIRKKG